MSTIQDVIGNYTPLSNNVVGKLKLVKGAVACKIFFTSNLQDRVCRMGLTRIANELGVEKSTASKAIKSLVGEKYIEVVKKATYTTPAHYRCTQKFYDLAGGVDLINGGVDLINGGGVDLINQEEESFKEEEEKNLPSQKTYHKMIINKCLEITGINHKDLSDTGTKKLALLVRWLSARKATEEELEHFKSYWWGDRPPSFNQIEQYWAESKATKTTNGKTPNLTPQQLARLKELQNV